MYAFQKMPDPATCVDLGAGFPNEKDLPLEKFRQAMSAGLSAADSSLLQYGEASGYESFRTSLSSFLSKNCGVGSDVSAENLFVTTGITGGLSLFCSLFTSSGDLVFVEEPTYFLALSVFKDFKLRVVGIPMDGPNGVDTKALEAAVETHGLPKFFYTVPTYHNPTGRTMSHEKRLEVARISFEYGFLVAADEVYQMLKFPSSQDPPKSMTAYDEGGFAGRDYETMGNIISFGSFAKILGPGARLGWIQAPEHILRVLRESGQICSGGGMNPIVSRGVHSFIGQFMKASWSPAESRARSSCFASVPLLLAA